MKHFAPQVSSLHELFEILVLERHPCPIRAHIDLVRQRLACQRDEYDAARTFSPPSNPVGPRAVPRKAEVLDCRGRRPNVTDLHRDVGGITSLARMDLHSGCDRDAKLRTSGRLPLVHIPQDAAGSCHRADPRSQHRRAHASIVSPKRNRGEMLGSARGTAPESARERQRSARGTERQRGAPEERQRDSLT